MAFQVLEVTPVCDVSAYTAGDVLFDSVECPGVFRMSGGTALLKSVTILDEDDNTAATLDLFFFRSNVSLGTFNAAPAITDVNAREIVGFVSFATTDWKDVGASKVAT